MGFLMQCPPVQWRWYGLQSQLGYSHHFCSQTGYHHPIMLTVLQYTSQILQHEHDIVMLTISQSLPQGEMVLQSQPAQGLVVVVHSPS